MCVCVGLPFAPRPRISVVPGMESPIGCREADDSYMRRRLAPNR